MGRCLKFLYSYYLADEPTQNPINNAFFFNSNAAFCACLKIVNHKQEQCFLFSYKEKCVSKCCV